MKALLLTLLHLTVMTATLCGRGGVRAVIAENLLLKQQLIVLRRPRQRAPHSVAVMKRIGNSRRTRRRDGGVHGDAERGERAGGDGGVRHLERHGAGGVGLRNQERDADDSGGLAGGDHPGAGARGRIAHLTALFGRDARAAAGGPRVAVCAGDGCRVPGGCSRGGRARRTPGREGVHACASRIPKSLAESKIEATLRGA